MRRSELLWNLITRSSERAQLEEALGTDAPLPTRWREYRKFVSYSLGSYLFAVSHNVTAATYFQLQQSGITVLVEGDKDTAKHVLQTTLRLQSAARWLQQTLPEFTAHYPEFGGFLHHDLQVDFPDEIPTIRELSPISPEEVHVLMGNLCSKLDSCRK